MRLTKEDAKVLNKIVENTTIDELLEEATIQAGHMAYILAQENKQDISVGSHRIAKDIAVNLGIICLLMDIASRDMRSCEDTITIYADDFAENTDSSSLA